MDPQGQVTILDYWRAVWRSRWLIFALAATASVVALGAGLLQPRIYTARATILLPKESAPQSLSASIGAMFLSGAGGGQGGREGGGLSLPGISVAVPSLSTNQDVYLALLKSRTLNEEVLAEFVKNWGPAVGSMVVSVKPDAKEKGIIGLAVEARDPKLAAGLANEYFAHLGGMLERYASYGTKRQESFYATQLERAAREVEAAEAAVLKFQSENRFLAVDMSTKREGEPVAMGRAAIMAYELQLETMRLRFTDQHPQIIELKKQIAELKQQYSRSLFGGAMDLPPESPTAKGPRKEFFVPAAKMTPVQLAFLKLYRNLKIQEAFYTAALQGLQQIKYGEGAPPAGVELLDPAVVPSAPSSPNIPFIVGVAALSAMMAGVFLALTLEYFAGVREQERRTRPPLPTQSRRSDGGAEPRSIPEARRVSAIESGAAVGERAVRAPAGGE